MLATAFKGLSLTSSSSLLGGRPCQTHRPLPLQRSPICPSIEAAHKKGGGSTKNGRDSNSQRRGCKKYGGQPIKAGAIIYRQLGTKWHPGEGVGIGKDFTLYATVPGIVVYQESKYIRKVHVVAKSEYVVPAGNTVKAENSRRTERKKEFPPRGMLRQQFERDVVSAPVTALAA